MKRETSNEYRYIGQRLIREKSDLSHIKECDIKVAYLTCEQEKKTNRKKVLADCTKVSDAYSWCCKYDFFITVYEPNIEGFTDKQKEILIWHELKHIGVSYDGIEPKFYVVPHDIEEFYSIIEEHGLHWDKMEV